MNRKFFISVVLLLFVLVASACFPFSGGIPVAGQPSNAETQNAAILQAVEATATTLAMQHQISVLQTQVAAAQGGQEVPTEIAAENATPTATFTATPTSTATPTATATATFTPTPTNTTVPTATATAIPCNQASFVKDVSVPDGTTYSPNTDFTKTWRIRNTGACTWTTGYDVVYTGGTRMGAPSVSGLDANVLPGQVIDVSVDMTAPSEDGTYRANFKLRDSSGVVFGLGRSNTTFFAEIRVSTPDDNADLPMNFIYRMCDASWTSGAGSLPCPGSTGDGDGYVKRINNPTLESGYVDDEPVLLMVPEAITDGYIRGKYPAVHVESGYHFISMIGCAYNDSGCDVKFQLSYQEGSGAVKVLKTWHEVYDKKFVLVDVDLSSLAGKNIKFILTVLANGSASKDKAQWLMPKIAKP